MIIKHYETGFQDGWFLMECEYIKRHLEENGYISIKAIVKILIDPDTCRDTVIISENGSNQIYTEHDPFKLQDDYGKGSRIYAKTVEIQYNKPEISEEWIDDNTFVRTEKWKPGQEKDSYIYIILPEPKGSE